MSAFLFFHAVITTGDVNITDSAIAAVAGPGAQVGTASVISELHSPLIETWQSLVLLV